MRGVSIKGYEQDAKLWEAVKVRNVAPYFTEYEMPYRRSAEAAVRDLYWLVEQLDDRVNCCGTRRVFGQFLWRAYADTQWAS